MPAGLPQPPLSASAEAWRTTLMRFIRSEAKPADKFSHQPRLHALCRAVGEGLPYDDDVVLAAAWLHDLGVFIGHRPEDPAALAKWDNVAYACRRAPELLAQFGFPMQKVPAVVAVIGQHLPAAEPASLEARILRDADILEQLGAAGILRTVSKVGRDTRFVTFADALRALRRNLEVLPGQLRLARAQELAQPRIAALRVFLEQAKAEAADDLW
jgi:uncharacterized protein